MDQDELSTGRASEESTRGLYALAQSCTDIFTHISEDLEIDYVSPSVTSLLGWPPEELSGTSVIALIHPDDVSAALSALERVRTGETVVFRGRVRNKDGSYRWLEARGGSLTGLDGRPSFFAALRDVKDEVGAEERYRLLAENAADVVATSDKNGVLQWVSPSVTDLLGWTPAEIVGKPFFQLIHPADVAAARSRYGSPRGGASTSGEVRLLRKDGTYRWISVASRAVLDATNGESYLVSGWHDITRRKEAEDKLARSELMLRSTLDNMLEGCLIIDRDWRYVYLNSQVEIQNRRPNAEILGRTVREAWPGLEDQEVFGYMKRSMDERTVERVENVLAFPDGSQGVFELVMQPVPEGLLMLSKDITQRREAERRLTEKEEEVHEASKLEALGILAGGIAHQFNNRLASILAGTELLLNDPSLVTPSALHYLRLMKGEIERAASLTRKMLDLAQKQMTWPSIVPINDVIKSAGSTLHNALGENVRAVLSLDPEAGQVAVDPHQLVTVLEHLATNARDAMPEGGRLLIETSTVELDEGRAGGLRVDPGTYVLLSAMDDGPGMGREVMSHLFEPFFSTKGEGKGLGLAAVRGIVRQSGGCITVSSEPGLGAAVHIYLPSMGR